VSPLDGSFRCRLWLAVAVLGPVGEVGDGAPPPPNVAPEVRSYADVVRHGLRVRAPPRRIRFAGDSRYGSPPPRPLLLSMLIGPPNEVGRARGSRPAGGVLGRS
jgi:hypothetical protein